MNAFPNARYANGNPENFHAVHTAMVSLGSSSFEFQAGCVLHISKCKVELLWKMNERMHKDVFLGGKIGLKTVFVS